ncbi:TPA: hypothetical protein QDZ99_003603 [Stenotrophomonas maltophilia]|nr:hypothetical protein [Stenotrophomonas maltophilia]HDS1158310.1 hypothetical protein [Stenotrophomonas maltophilia]HDS1167154.1 hypothetical protein [Stenotrophomonas maltophilia]HDS1171860.1 hypothetical protein [Stenotrophomonas maltophilia]HDS1176521.1 hypothetical protein [Stenotrophomonas maltophilia]
MAEIISFPQRMPFTAIRTYDAASGIGGVVAVLFAPARKALVCRPIHAVSAGQMSGRIAARAKGSQPSSPPISTDAS